MPQGRISKRSVDALACPPGRDRVFLWDDDLAGFGLAAFASGKRVYVAQYRQDGRSRRISIGDHGRLTPEQARSEAKKLLGGVEQGLDPIKARKTARQVRTFSEVAHEFLVRHMAAKRKPATRENYAALLDRHILPAIGSIRITDLRRADIMRLHDKLSDLPATADRVLAIVSSIWGWAASKEEVAPEKNPCARVERFGQTGRERFLTSVELGRLGDALHRAETTGLPYGVDETKPKARHAAKPENRLRQIDILALAAIRLLILTGARLREILDAKWSHVDLERGIIHLPDSKTGRKPIYLSAAAMSVLAEIPKIEGNPHIIAGAKRGAPRADLKKPWAAITGAADLPGLRIHDLRHSFASVGAGASLGLPIIGKLLGHTQARTTARYAHLDADPMRRAVNTIGSTIEAAMRSKPVVEPTPMPTKRRLKK